MVSTVEIARMQVVLTASINQFNRQMDKATRKLGTSSRKMERRVEKLDKRFERLGSKFGIQLNPGIIAGTVALAAFGKALNDVVKSGDKLKLLEGRFKALTGSAERAGNLIDAAFEIGSETGATFDAITSGLTRFTIAAEAIEATDAEVVQLTQNLLKLGTIGGGSAQEVRSGIIQLGQSLAKGRLDGDELRSVMENLPLVARAIADSFGVGIGQLKKMGEEGRLLSEQVFAGLLSRTAEIDAQFAELPLTVDRAATMMANSWIRFTNELDKTIDSSGILATIFESAANAAEILAVKLETADKRRLARLQDEALELAGLIQIGGEKAKLDEDAAAKSEMASGLLVSSLIREQRLERDALALGEKKLVQLNDEIRLLQIKIALESPTVGNIPGNPSAGRVGSLTRPGPIPPLPRPANLGVIDLQNEDRFSKTPKGRTKKVDTQAADLLDQMRSRIKLLGQEGQVLGLNNVETAKLNALFEKQNSLKKLQALIDDEKIPVTEQQIEQAKALAAEIEKETIALAKNTQVLADRTRSEEEYRQAITRVSDAISNAIIQADSFEDALRNIAVALANIALQESKKEGGGFLGKLLGGLGALLGGDSAGGGSAGLPPAIIPGSASAKGNVFAGGNVVPFARGGIVDSPTVFPMKNGIGLLGEAGPEAILPLKRGPGGRLGVEASGGRGGGTVVNIINNTGAEVTEQQRTGQGGVQIRDIIIGTFNDASGTGELDSTFKGRFGLSPQRVRR